MRKIVVIGGSAAGMMAAVTAAKENPDAKVAVVTLDKLPYRRPAIPSLIAGCISEPKDAQIFTKQMLAGYNIELICPAEATGIDTESKTISIDLNGEDKKLSYDAAVIATGGHPMIPKIPGSDKNGVCTFTTYEAAVRIVQYAQTARSAVVVGAGFIALEIAEALMHKGLDVYFNVRSRILRKLLEPELSRFLSDKFQQRGLKMLTEQSISQIGGDNKVEYIVHKDRKIATDIVIMGTGVKPNITLAEKCGIEIGHTGAIKVDNRMQTSVSDIYAVGDCAESPDLGTDSFVYMPVGSVGACAGRIAGQNAAGADQTSPGFLRAQADKILGLQIFSIGHSSTTAKEVGLEVRIDDLDIPKSVAENQTSNSFEAAKLLTDTQNNIVGAQLIAKKYGSQYACQLYKAVLEKENKESLLQRFHSPRLKVAEKLDHTMDAVVQTESLEK